MRSLLGRLTWGVSLGVLLASVGASEVKAAGLYEITVSINDTTTPANSTSFTILSTNPGQNTSVLANQITVSGTALSNGVGTSGITFASLGSSYANGSSSSALNIGGTLQVTTTDNYMVTISTTYQGYTQPLGPTSTMSESSSGTYTYTAAGTQSQAFQSWYTYPAPGTPFPPTGPTTGSQSIVIPGSTSVPTSGSAPTLGTTFPTGTGNSPFTLSNVITLSINGSSSTNSPTFQFQGSTIITAVPEPASVVMMLTGMPMPLMVLGMLRRRKARRADV
jgi:hypothetical protein